jgi:hypothetical protein
LRLKEGNPTYEGTLSFIASKPVEVQILHRNMTQSSFNTATTVPTIPPEFGTMTILPLPGGSGQVVSSLVLPQYPEDATSFFSINPIQVVCITMKVRNCCLIQCLRTTWSVR